MPSRHFWLGAACGFAFSTLLIALGFGALAGWVVEVVAP